MSDVSASAERSVSEIYAPAIVCCKKYVESPGQGASKSDAFDNIPKSGRDKSICPGRLFPGT
jgi:hypothetical protein